MESNEYVIQCENLCKRYALYQKRSDRLRETLSFVKKSYHTDFYALNDISFKVSKGECVGIIGKNGSGKSTLLKILTGVLTPSAGTAKINGRIAALLELGAGFNQEYTGYENIYLNGTIMGYSREEMDQKIPEILEFADIGDFIHQPVKTYSSGMFVRLAFAVAINVEPDVLIVDEALAVGDVFFQLKCYKKFEDFKKQGKTILFVSHDQSSIIKYCDRAILLNEGSLICDTTTKEAIEVYKKILTKATEKKISEQISETLTEIDTSTQWNINYTKNEKCLDYGDKKAEIIDFGIFDSRGKLTTNFYRNEFYEIRSKVRFHETLNDPIFSITFKDLMGLEVAGTNTMLEKIETGRIEAGETVVASFRLKFPFQNQAYFLSLGTTRFNALGELEVSHRLYDIICVETVGPKATNGFFDVDADVKVRRN